MVYKRFFSLFIEFDRTFCVLFVFVVFTGNRGAGLGLSAGLKMQR